LPRAALKFWKEAVNPGSLILEHIQVAWEGLQGDAREIQGVMNMIIILIMVMVSCM